MRILIDSLTCNPRCGSNAEAGYGFVLQAARRHAVHLLTHRDCFFSEGNTPECFPSGAVTVHSVAPGIMRRLGQQTDYLAQCLPRSRTIVKKFAVDLVHTVEPTQFHGPRPLCFLNRPFVLGPLNGGDNYPPVEFLRELDSVRNPGSHSLSRSGLKARAVDSFNRLLIHGSLGAVLTRLAFKRAAMIAVGTRNVLRNIPRIHHEKCMEVPCFGLDLREFSPANREPNTPPVLLYAGRITPWKGLDLLIRACADVARHSTIQLRIAGTGAGNPEDERFEVYCRELSTQLGIGESTVFLGHLGRRDLRDRMRQADLFCSPSLWEPYGLAILEALACGVPVVAMKSGGPAELIRQSFGVTIEPRTVSQFVQELSVNIRALLGNTARLSAFSASAREHMESCHHWDRVGLRMEQAYQAAMAQSLHTA